MGDSSYKFWICFALVAVIFAVYGQVIRFEFTNYDDPEYVIENPHLALTLNNLSWAMTSGYAGNWFPLTWLSHMVDFQLFGLRSGPHHLTNVLLHAASTILLFTVLFRMTNSLWPSAFVAAFFALHPLRAESVAWVAERKDVLSTFFWMLTMWCYARYAELPSVSRYAWVVISFGLGLMAKPMLVTLPFALLLLDVWPLHRINRQTIWRRIAEKLPMLALSVGVSVVNYVVQKGSGAVMPFDVVPPSLRIENALISYAMYLKMLVWPVGLVPFYPMPATIPIWQPLVAGIVVVTVTLFAVMKRRAHPYFIVGWLWYLGTLVPVLGLISFGAQARADRYTYVPAIGILVMVAWATSDLVRHHARIALAVRILSVVAMAVCVGLCFTQVSYWRDSITLFRHTIDVDPNNYLAYNNLGVALSRRGEIEEAIECYRKAMSIPRNTDLADPYINMGAAMLSKDNAAEAANYLSKALEYAPDSAKAHSNMGEALSSLGRTSEALEHFRKSIQIEPENAEVQAGIGRTLAELGAADEALAHLREALRIRPDFAGGYFDLGEAYGMLGRLDEAERAFEESIRLDPTNARAHFNLGIALGTQDKFREAAIAFRAAIRIKPDYPTAWFNLGNALAQDGLLTDAAAAFAEAVRLQPDFPEASEALTRVQTLLASRKNQ